MSWRKSGAFKVSNEVTVGHKDKPEGPYMRTIEKEMAFKRLEVDVLQTDYVESSLLIMNSKDMMITSNRLNIQSKQNSIHIPATGPIRINKAVKIHEDTVQISGNLQVENEFRLGTCRTLVKRLDLQPRTLLDKTDYKGSNTFVIDCNEKKSKCEIVLTPYNAFTAEWSPNKIDYLYTINFLVNASPDALVDIDISIPKQDLCIKLLSRYSSISLLWVPEGRWLVQSLGFKTTIINT